MSNMSNTAPLRIQPRPPEATTPPAPHHQFQVTRKRRRVAVACNSCRSRKSRCNGAHPICSTCRDSNSLCVYQKATNSTASRKRSGDPGGTSSLQSRLEALEEKLRDLPEDRIHNSSNTVFSESPAPSIRNPAGIPYAFNDDGQSRSSQRDRSASPDREQIMTFGDGDDPADGMATVLLDDHAPGFDCHFGPTSTISFFRSLSSAMIQAKKSRLRTRNVELSNFMALPKGKGQNDTGTDEFAEIRRDGGKREAGAVDIYAIPSESETLLLIGQYFETVGQFLPCLNQDAFLDTYKKARAANFRNIRRSWLALLNIIFANASSTLRGAKPIEQRLKSADVFYRRSLGLASSHILSGTGLETVQLLLLLTSYCHGTQRAIQAWTMHSLSVKAAMQMGLHSPEASKKLSLLERELRKRAWFLCVTNDRTIAITMGRPPLIPESYIRKDLPIDINDEFPSLYMEPSLVKASLEYFNAVIMISSLTWQTCENLYGQNLGFTKEWSYTDFLKFRFDIRCQLEEWKSTLPVAMPILSCEELVCQEAKDIELTRFTVFLTLRYHGLCVLVDRPILLNLLDQTMFSCAKPYEIAILKERVPSLVLECIESCKEMIGIVGIIVSASERNLNLNGAYWISAYFAFSSALTLFSILLGSMVPGSPIVLSEDQKSDGMTAIHLSLEHIRGLDKYTPMTRGCCNCIERLIEHYTSLVSEIVVPNQTESPYVVSDAISSNMDATVSSNPISAGADFPNSNVTNEVPAEFNFDFTDLDFLSGFYEDGSMSNLIMPGSDMFFPN